MRRPVLWGAVVSRPGVILAAVTQLAASQQVVSRVSRTGRP